MKAEADVAYKVTKQFLKKYSDIAIILLKEQENEHKLKKLIENKNSNNNNVNVSFA